MFVGNLKKINLSTSIFERLITKGQFYVDKTRIIEYFLEEASDVQLITRQRRLGKSLNMDTLRCFLTNQADNRHLFKGLYIESSHVWEEANSWPVFKFDFKQLTADSYVKQLIVQVDEQLCSAVNPNDFDERLKRRYDAMVNAYENPNQSILLLMEIVYKLSGKRSFILIDEYDKLLMDNFISDKYEELRTFIQNLFSATFKDNQYLEKALLTGVMRVSKESVFSNLNNISVFDVFGDSMYTNAYGFTEDEVRHISKHADIDVDEARKWYNGVRINGMPIYNTYSFSSYLKHNNFECFWGMSGAMDLIVDMLNDERKLVLTALLNQEPQEVLVSLKWLSKRASDKAFYSLLVQAGYLSILEWRGTNALVTIPNKELVYVWKNFIIEALNIDEKQISNLFDHVDNEAAFSQDVEYFLTDRLSYHDLAKYSCENSERAHERAYHLYLLGILSAFEDVRCRFPLSNRESGNGRYDIWVERPNVSVIFELKACNSKEDLDKKAQEALNQIDAKRYGAELVPGKKIIKVGIAFHKKSCKVRVRK